MILGEDVHSSHTHASHETQASHGNSMAMYFVNSIQVTLWTERWTTDSFSSYVVALLALFCMGVAYEHISTYRRELAGRTSGAGAGGKARMSRSGSDDVTLLVHQDPVVLEKISNNGNMIRSNNPAYQSAPGWDRLTMTLLYSLQTLIGYLLMLAVMTYNIGCCAAVMLGLGVGYYICYDPSLSAAVLARGDSCHG